MKKLKAILAGLMIVLIFPQAALAATLSVSPSSGTFNRSCSYSADILLDTKGADTDGTDALLKFDPAKLTPISITPGSVYPDYPAASFDKTAGTISISGLSSVSTPFNGNGKFATINFTVNSNVNSGDTTSLRFDYDPQNPSKTTDSNVVQSVTVQDILQSVTDGNYTLGTGSCAGGIGSTGTTVTGGTGTGTAKGGLGTSKGGLSSGSGSLDDLTGNGAAPGILDNTLLLTIGGSIFVLLGIMGLALL